MAYDVNLLVRVSTQTVKNADPNSSFNKNFGSSNESHFYAKGGSISPSNPHDINAPMKAPKNWASKYQVIFLCLLSTYIPIVMIGLTYPPVISPD